VIKLILEVHSLQFVHHFLDLMNHFDLLLKKSPGSLRCLHLQEHYGFDHHFQVVHICSGSLRRQQVQIFSCFHHHFGLV